MADSALEGGWPLPTSAHSSFHSNYRILWGRIKNSGEIGNNVWSIGGDNWGLASASVTGAVLVCGSGDSFSTYYITTTMAHPSILQPYTTIDGAQTALYNKYRKMPLVRLSTCLPLYFIIVHGEYSIVWDMYLNIWPYK